MITLKLYVQLLLVLLCGASSACALSDDEPSDGRRDWRLVKESDIAGRVATPDGDDNDDPLVYQSCKISVDGMFVREEVIGALTPEIQARVDSPLQFLSADEPWIYSESWWNEATEDGESFVCYQVTRAPNPNAA
jgi:transglutaminase-like putative cysteine protease